MTIRRRPPAQDIGRILGGKMAPEDFIKMMNATELNCDTLEKIPEEDAEDFVNVCERLGDEAFSYAEKNEQNGHLETASEYYFNANALYRLGDYGIKSVDEEKYRIYGKLVDSFKRSKQLMTNGETQYIEVPFDGKKMPAYLLIPENAPKDVPVVICVVGATGFKEENFIIAETVLNRGAAAIIFDGPGQGECNLNRDLYLTETNYDDAVLAIVDYIKGHPDLGDKIGLAGVSFGGYLATSAACRYPEEFSGLVVRGGCSQLDQLTMHNFAGIDKFYMYNFLNKFNVESLDEAEEISHKMNLDDVLKNITCPVLVQHTTEDPVIGTVGAKTIYQNCSSKDKEYYEIPGNVHCGNNEAQKTCTYGIDWLLDRLK